jgi:uncharacterized protein (DUF2267 family)
MDERELIRRVKDGAGLRTAREAKRALSAAIGALGCALDDDDSLALSKALPLSLGRLLERRRTVTVSGVQALYEEAEHRECVGRGFAAEHLQTTLGVLARELNPELVTRLRKHLSPDVAALFEERASSPAPPPYVHVHPHHLPSPIQTLSRARPGTAEPIADVHHELAHASSVVRSPAPHAERMVETARSTRPSREDETLASAEDANRR